MIKTLEPQELFSQKIYWLNKLSGELPETNLIQDYVRPLQYSGKNQSHSFELPLYLSQEIIKLTKGSHFLVYIILLSAFKILLQKYARNNDLIVGIPTLKKIEHINLDFLNNDKIIPLRTQLNNEITFKNYFIQVRDTVIQAYSHQDYCFDELIKVLNLPQSQNRCPIFDVVVLLENIHSKAKLTKLNNDLTISFIVENNTICGSIEYNQLIFNYENIKLLGDYYINVIQSIISDFDIKISEIDFFHDSDRYKLLKQYNSKIKDYPIAKTVNTLFEEQVEKTPNNIAVIHKNSKLTYRELNEKANKLARLLRKLGVSKGDFVGIFKDRDINFLVGILGIHKAGGAYVPIDSTYPSNRIEYMLSNSEVRFVLTDFSLLNTLDLKTNSSSLQTIICLDKCLGEKIQFSQYKLTIYDELDFNNLPENNLESVNQAVDPAYILYTSGSTGLPKGAIVRHDGAINHIYAQFDELELTSEFCFLQSAPSSTDISVWQFLAPLLIGGKTVIVDIETVAIAKELFKALFSEKITVVELVPALFGNLLEYISYLPNYERELPDLKWMILSGESAPIQWVNKWLEIYPHIRIANAYGPSEAADDITQFIIDKPFAKNQRTVPIGKPLANLNLYILDPQMKLLPIGAPGEICVSGIGVGAGYWKNEQKTKDSFVANPFTETEKKLPGNRQDLIYKTGDLGRWLTDGNIEFLGRIDNQVKIRGFRVELGEIEAFLGQHPNIREVVVNQEEADNPQLVAYIVPSTEAVSSISELRSFLKEKLPDRMIPSFFVMLENLPLAPSGKVDRKALPKPDNLRNLGNDYVAPRNQAEATIAKLWQQLLEIEQIGIYDNFFQLGGHSLIATRVISQIRQLFQVEFPLRCLFEKPTIAGLAKEIEKASKADLGLEMPPIKQIERVPELPLSFAQQRLWFLTQLEPNSFLYNIPGAVRLKGKLNVEALQQSFNEIVRRHEALRTNFRTKEGRAVAVISKVKTLTLPILDISSLSAFQQQAEVKYVIAQEAKQSFDLASDHLLRLKLLRLSKQEHIVLLTIHHIISDGWSVGVLVQEFSSLYQAFYNAKPISHQKLPIQYVDFAAWQRQWLQGELLETQISYWLKQLENASKVLELPTDRPRPAIQTFRGATYSFKLSKELSAALNKLSQHQGTTLFMTLLAGFQTLLWRYTGQEDIVVGSPIANRNRVELEGLIGFFVNTLVLRTNLAENSSFEELLKQVREVALGAYAHQDLPFELLVDRLQPQRDLSYTPLFQVMFVLQNAPMSALELPELTLTPLQSDRGSAQFDLTLQMTETESGLVGSFEYNTDLFEESSIQRMVIHLQTLLSGIVANPQQRLSELPLLTESEQHRLLREWNNTEVEYPLLCIHELFEAQVEKTPTTVAVVFEDQQLTYRELNAKANQLANHLRSHGVKPEVLVGICLERSLDMVIGLLAILKAGGAYIPLDPTYPLERLQFILEDTQARVLLTQESLLEAIPQHEAEVICLDDDYEAIAQQSQENLCTLATTDNLAYIIYTSGSTGKPKGVQIPHSALSNFLYSMKQEPGLTSDDTLLAVTTYSFDIAALELFLPISVGARLVVASREIVSDGTQLLAKLIDSKATVMQATPATWQLLLAAGWDGSRQLKILCGGEALPKKLANQLLERCDCLWNMYGPTETTIWSAASQIKTDSKIIPISYPIANTQLYILDQYSQLVPMGIAGELCIGGEGLARGYFNRPDLSAEKFIPNPFSTEATRLYKTGDLARYLPSGDIEYLGRIDNQVKIRGFRIELGEIEAVISQYPAIRETVVVVREDSVDSQRIVAYVVAKGERTLAIAKLRNFLESKLPNYMIPGAFVTLEALPLTPNGKVDRKALPIPDTARPELDKGLVEPRNFVEAKLSEIWAQVLGIDKVGVFDNFFELGGDSILAIVAITRANQAGLQLTVKQLFQHQTVADLATIAVIKKLNTTEQKVIINDTTFNFTKANLNKQDLEKFLTKVKRGSQKQ